MKLEKTKKQIKKFAKNYAESKGFRLNPNEKELDMIIHGLAKNKINKKRQYCPCRILTGDKSDKDKICPCKWHKDEIKNNGHCKCKLFFKKQ